MISNEEFASLRFKDFFPCLVPAILENWEYQDRNWVGEAFGFTEWLCPEDSPSTLGSIALDLPELPQAGLEHLLNRLGLPLSLGMSREQVFSCLGPPINSFAFTNDRSTYDFQVSSGGSYLVSCTIKRDGGLCYLTMLSIDRPHA